MGFVSQLSPGPELEPDFRGYEPIHPEPGWKSMLRKAWAPIAVVVGLIVKFGVFTFKFLGLFVSIGAYALIWGWRFGVGFVALILVHEMGHYVQARLEGVHVSLPIFIPFFGAFVTLQHANLTPWRHAKIALAGPIAGGAGAAAVWAWGESSGSRLLQALGYAGFLINLFNLLPVGFLDGGAIWRSIGYLRRGGAPDRAFLLGVLYGATALALVLGMWAAHVHQNRL
jgi:membrane-associated protease RseP (regulator of RpoE activity)